MEMKEQLMKQWNKYKEIILYLVFGAATTGVNFIVYFICRPILNLNVNYSIFIAWFITVLFAFVTNKYIVFHSKNSDEKVILKEALLFYWYRILSLLLELGMMWLLLQQLSWTEWWAKIFIQVIVIVANYVFSKVFIFKSSNQQEKKGHV